MTCDRVRTKETCEGGMGVECGEEDKAEEERLENAKRAKLKRAVSRRRPVWPMTGRRHRILAVRAQVMGFERIMEDGIEWRGRLH
eukprot:3942909-Pyramimonas_sp.AAC.1